MSLLSSSCCCGKCFFGIRSADPLDPNFDDFVACAHSTAETLELKIPRPAYNSGVSEVGITQDGSSDVCPCVGIYKFSASAPASSTIEVDYEHFHQRDQAGRVYTWFYETPLNVYPSCEDACSGYDQTSPGPNDFNCCDDPVPSNQQCSQTHRVFSAIGNIEAASRFQQDVITTGVAPHLSSELHAEDSDFGEDFFFLQGISNSSSTKLYKHWEWNTSTNSVQQKTNRTLERTMLCVVHKEKWWVRDYNSLTLPDNQDGSASDRGAANSRTPKYWSFGCSGVPLFSWEIRELSSLTTAQQDEVFEAVGKGEFIPENLCDILESDGILEVKDYGRSDGKIVKKTLRAAAHPLEADVTQYFFARPGGWTFVCQDFAASPATAILNWPQIARQSRFNPSGDSFGTSGCFTGAPIPTNGGVACNSTKIDGPVGSGTCDVCGTLPDGCDLGTASVCGDVTPEICLQDMIVGNCKGCWIQFTQYQTGTGNGGLGCGGSYDSYLCRVAPEETQCDFGSLPDEMSHRIPVPVSNVSRQPGSTTTLCCDGDASFSNNGPKCPANTVDSTVQCDDPTVWGPNI